jgi:hypothetical protein
MVANYRLFRVKNNPGQVTIPRKMKISWFGILQCGLYMGVKCACIDWIAVFAEMPMQ